MTDPIGAGVGVRFERGRSLCGHSLADARTNCAATMAGPLAHLERVRGGEPQGASGPAGFLELPYQTPASLSELCAHAQRLRADPAVDQVVWVGLGGSVLGPQMLVRALGDDRLPIHFVDTLDPEDFCARIAPLPPSRTHYVLASKSGSTAETMLVGGWILQLLAQAGLGAARHLTLVTGPTGPLVSLGAPRFEVPPSVGGRFTVLTPVGLLAAALAGISVEGLLGGARAADAARAGATAMSAWLYLEALRGGRGVFPFVVYDQRLALVGDWVQQLLMESLGKRFDRDGKEVRCGLTVLAARGTGAQHSMLQEWMEGPADKCLTFVVTEDGREGPPLGPPLADHPAVAALAGHTPRAVQQALYQGTADALQAAGSPSVSLVLARVDAPALGALILHLEIVCALMADALNVCAYDQPGVEQGKQRARALLARTLADTPDRR